MKSLFLAAVFATAIFAEQSGNLTLTAGSSLNLETGEIGRSGGDLLWNGIELTSQGSARLYNVGKLSARVFKSISSRAAARAPFTATSIPASKLIAGDIFGVRTNSGHYAKVLVTAVNGLSLVLQYTMFSAPGPIIAPHPDIAGPPPFIYRLCCKQRGPIW